MLLWIFHGLFHFLNARKDTWSYLDFQGKELVNSVAFANEKKVSGGMITCFGREAHSTEEPRGIEPRCSLCGQLDHSKVNFFYSYVSCLPVSLSCSLWLLPRTDFLCANPLLNFAFVEQLGKPNTKDRTVQEGPSLCWGFKVEQRKAVDRTSGGQSCCSGWVSWFSLSFPVLL